MGGAVGYPELWREKEGTYANGSGKSTLVRHIVEAVQLPAQRLIYLPQEISADE